MANSSVPETLKGAEQIKSTVHLLAGFAQLQAKQNSEEFIAREASNSRDAGLEKTKGEIYFGCRQSGEVAGSSFNNQLLHLQDGHPEFGRERFRGAYAREQIGST